MKNGNHMKLELAEKEDNSRFVNVYNIIIFIIMYVVVFRLFS